MLLFRNSTTVSFAAYELVTTVSPLCYMPGVVKYVPRAEFGPPNTLYIFVKCIFTSNYESFHYKFLAYSRLERLVQNCGQLYMHLSQCFSIPSPRTHLSPRKALD